MRGAIRALGLLALTAGIIFASLAAPHLGPLTSTAAHAAEPESPEVYKFQGFWNKIDGDVDEIRADVVLRLPRGYVDPVTGNLLSVDGQQLRVGHDYNTGSTRQSHRYINTISGGATGAEQWAKNRDQYFTIHKVIPSGKYDFVVISIEGDIDITNAPAATNIPGGLLSNLNFYFSYAAGAPGTSSTWVSSALTTEPAAFYWYYGTRNDTAITGPQFRIPWDNTQTLWSAGQANWGAVLDFGLNGYAEGILPPNSVGLDLVNNATRSNAESGYGGTVSDSFWYAWVHEDGSLVEAINTAPIRVTGVTPSGAWITNANQIPKNVAQADWPGRPVLGWTQEQADQGLTTNVGLDGSIDFTTAGGTGYYRLMAWPESRNPVNQSGDNGAPLLSYSADDLFDAGGMLTPAASAAEWTTATVYYKYELPIPDAPVITVPPADSHSNVNSTVTFSGTGTPGHTITLKFKPGSPIFDFDDPALDTLIDGQHEGILDGDVVVDGNGNWTFTYIPPTPLADGEYSVVAVQTNPAVGQFAMTSAMSNPNSADPPSAWGVQFTIDTVAPAAVTPVCPASPTTETAPTISGSGAEAGARVFVAIDGERVGEATVTGSTWTYTVDPPLGNGTYSFTVTQVDRAGNESAVSDPACEIRVATAVPATGSKVVQPVEYGDPDLPSAAAANWEITLTDASETVVIDDQTTTPLKRDTEYTIGERLRSEPTPDPIAARYTQLGGLSCVDAEGIALPPEAMDPDAGTLTVSSDLDLAEPISCTITNQAAHVSLVTQRLGGQTTSPSAGWSLELQRGEPGLESTLTDATPHDVAKPGPAELVPGLPDSLALIAVQSLDLDRSECAAAATAPAAAPQDCWITIDGADHPEAIIAQGKHTVFRMVAATPAELPALPVTGGLDSWSFFAGGALAVALAAIAYWRRRYLLSHQRIAPLAREAREQPRSDGRDE
ncbi:Ig-like domain-containing protein [Leucobacter sp. NPDC015123]|uniref:Ig-like domain-containing protein n=1 Tax=Leucobacter sp. NPDC015123 TaxID=3364129 RepID=UPI0036F4647B